MADEPVTARDEARWPAVVAVLAAGGLYAALPASLAVGPRWMLPVLLCALETPTLILHRTGRYGANKVMGYVLSAILTAFMLWSLVLLVIALPAHKEQPLAMLRSAAALWVTNVLVFAVWYWRLDAGGPRQRSLRQQHESGAFLFPQMTLNDPDGDDPWANWSPLFVDYLFLAFNTSTAFSPTDAPVLSRWAKVLVMLQSTISLAVVALLAARAINIL